MSSVRRRNVESVRLKEGIEKTDSLFETEKHEKDPSLLSTVHWIFICLVYITVILTTVYLHKCLPTPLEPNSDDSRFSEVRAINILHELSDFGWKPAGSHACEQLTRNRILEELLLIKNSSSSSIDFDIDTQYVDGCFELATNDVDGFSLCYRNVSNVIARLGKTSTKANEVALMLNCHYDSWPASSAGSDDLSSCALMLELLRIYSKHPNYLKHNVIFLFNGAEESSLLAAHGFITQHRWRHDIRAFVNLEACGSGGRELLFQAGPANEWLLNSYLEAAVHPHCSVIGQEVFQSGVYPGDTDFRVFRDHGRVPGLDLAFVQNGYWWHTEFDESQRITPGSLQRAGENVFSTVNHLLQSPYLEKPAEYADRKTVFFDFLGLFVVIYPLSLAHTINICAILAVVLLTFKSASKNGSIFLTALFHYFVVVASMATVIFIMTKMSVFTYGALRWYTRHWLAVLAYGVPTVWCGLTVHSLLVARVLPKLRSTYSSAIETIHLLFVSLILLFFTYYNIASGFLFALLLIPVVKHIFSSLLPLDSWSTVLLTLFFSIPGCSMSIYTSEMLLSIFIPIMGRTSVNPEPIVAFFVAFSAFSLVLSLLGLVARTDIRRQISEASFVDFIYIPTGIILVTLTILYFIAGSWPSPFNFLHEYPTAKRTQFFHVNQQFYDRDGLINTNETRFYAISHDYRGAEDIPFVRSDENYTTVTCHYANNPYCEIPYYFPTRNRIKERHIRMKKVEETLKFAKQTKILQISKKHGEENGRPSIEYSFSVMGSGQMSVYVVPDEGWAVSATSVAAPPAEPQPHMFLFFKCSTPTNYCEWMFKITIVKTDKRVTDEKPLLIGVSSHYLHGNQMQSKTIKKMLREIEQKRITNPEWTISASSWNVDQIYKYF